MSARDRLTAMYVPTSDADETDWEQRLNAYRAEVLAEAAPPCAVCDTSIEWVACPTGGWWAHHNHPEDGHDALPPGVPSRTEVLAEVASWSDYSNDDYATWTDTTAPTPADGYAGTRGEPGPVNQ
jgi:hypothetical protein